MDTLKQKIKKLMHAHEIDFVADLAREFEQLNPGQKCCREQMSMCVNGLREYPVYRQFLADRFQTTVEQLFGPSKKSRKAA